MKNLAFYLTFLLATQATPLSADSFWDLESWRPVCGLESGAAISSDAGQSKNFPIASPATEFYNYSVQHKSQSEAIYGGFIGAQWQQGSPWIIQLDLNYNQSTPFSVNGILTQGVDIPSSNSYDFEYKIVIRQLLFEGKIAYDSGTRFRPYAIVGIGSSFNRAYSFSTTAPASLTFTRDYENHSTAAFTYALGVGLDVELIRSIWGSIGYRFTDFGRASLGSASINGTPVSGTLSQSNFYANEFLVQLTLAF